MKKLHNIFHDNDHRWAVITRDPDRPAYMIDTNECLVVSGNEAILTDPGGMEIFPAVFSAISTSYNLHDIKAIFSSHQDPDIISSLTLWLEVNPELKCYISWLWSTFVPHFGGTDTTFISIPDEGMTIKLGSINLQCIPAHYLHSAGNFHLYDSRAKIYFSGDVGAALLDYKNTEIYVKNFDEHIKSAKKFHQRWMGSNEARLDWCERVSQLEIDMLVPQHGSIYQGNDVKRFIDWFSELKVGLFTMGADVDDQIKIEEPQHEVVVELPEPGLPEITENARPDHPDITDHSDLKALIDQDSSLKTGTDEKDLFNKPARKSFFSAIKNFFKS
jgi:flavorubredoxin